MSGDEIANSRVDNTQPLVFAADNSVSEKAGVPICDDFACSGKYAFSGKIAWVDITVGDDNHDHYIDEEDRVRTAVSLQ
jgi:arylsulfatase